METDAALVGTYGAVHLDAVTFIYHNLSGIGNPGNAEHNHALRLYDALHNFELHQLGVFYNHRSDAFYDLPDGLVELLFTGVLGNDISH